MSMDVLGLAASLGFVDEQYARFVTDAASVDPSWAALLGELPAAQAAPPQAAPAQPSPIVVQVATAPPAARPKNGSGGNGAGGNGQGAVVHGPRASHTDLGSPRPGSITLAPLAGAPSVWPLVNAYRSRGHL